MTCPYCGSEIHDQAVLCVHCGKQLSSQFAQNVPKETKTCPNCGSECYKDAVICVKCGTAFTKNEQLNKNITSRRKNNKGKQAAFAILSVIFYALSTGGGLYYAFTYSFEVIDLTYLIPEILV